MLVKNAMTVSRVGRVCAFLLVALAGSGVASAPKLIAFQGELVDTAGAPYPDSAYSISFAIDSTRERSSSPLWRSTRTVSVRRGLVSVVLGEQKALDLPFDMQYWVHVTVNGAESRALSPVKLLSAPYAFRADTAEVALSIAGLADSLAGKAEKSYVDSIAAADTVFSHSSSAPSQAVWVTAGGRVGIGTISPSSKLEIAGGDLQVSEPGAGIILHDENGAAFKLHVSDTGSILLDPL